MTTNQAIALLFPLFAGAAVVLTGVMIAKPWNRKKTTNFRDDDVRVTASSVVPGEKQTTEAMRVDEQTDEVVRRIELLALQLQRLTGTIAKRKLPQEH